MSFIGSKRLHAEEEYGSQLHKCIPYKLYDDMVTVMKWVIDEGVEGFEGRLKQMLPECDSNTASSLIKSEWYASINRNGPELLNAIKDSLQIPQDMLLPEDAVQKRQYSDEELEEIRKRTLDLRARYRYNNQLKEALLAESSVQDSLEDIEAKVTEWQEIYKKCCDETSKVKDAVNLLMSTKDGGIDVIQRSTVLSSVSKSLEQ